MTAPEVQNGLREALDAFEEAIREEVRWALHDTGQYRNHRVDLRKERRQELDARLASLIAERDAARELAGLTWTAPDVDAWGKFADEKGAPGIRDRLNRLFRRAVMAEEQVRHLLNDADRQGQDALRAAEAEITRLKEGMEARWRPMDTAPNDVPIYARHKPNEHTPHGWIALIRRRAEDPDEGRGCGRDTILHYNGEASLRGFYGCWTGWLWPEELATLSPKEQPHG